jgi:hypothetical protein
MYDVIRVSIPCIKAPTIIDQPCNQIALRTETAPSIVGARSRRSCSFGHSHNLVLTRSLGGQNSRNVHSELPNMVIYSHVLLLPSLIVWTIASTRCYVSIRKSAFGSKTNVSCQCLLGLTSLKSFKRLIIARGKSVRRKSNKLVDRRF